jgi:hypothetical protein
MNRVMRRKRIWIIAVVIAGLWFFTGKLLMELEWRDLDSDSTTVEDRRRDLAEGRTGPVMRREPCMTNQTTVNLDLRLDGPFPIGTGREIVMDVYISSDELMVDRLYLGPPTRHLVLDALPICLLTSGLPDSNKDNAAFGYVDVRFTDLENRRFVTFGGEDPFPIFIWRTVRVDWSVVHWVMEGTESLSQIMVTPQ